jgi:hypothetical protein
MAQTARQIAVFIPGAGETRPMRIAAGTPHPVATDAELLAGSPVTARARRRIHPRLQTVVSTARGQPSWRVWTARRGFRSHVLAHVAVDARAFRVTGRTESDVGARFLGMTCGKARAVEA